MKKILPLCALLTGMFASLTSCSNQDNPNGAPDNIPEAVIKEFNSKYPGASDVVWSTKEEHAVASFYLAATRNGQHEANHTAWFSMDGKWGMTETEIPFSSIPQAVKDAFESSEYSTWTVDPEVDLLQRNDNSETLYIIEVSRQADGIETDADLYYTSEGILVKAIIDAEADQDYHEYLPQTPTGKIETWLETNYPDARIIDIDRESNGTEVEIVSEGRRHDILFDAQQEWVYTQTDYARHELDLIPASILAFLRTSPHYTNDRAIDDIEKYETREAGVYYSFELQTGFDDDVTVYVNETGIISRPHPGGGSEGQPGNNGSSIPVEEAILNFIQTRYPDAVIIEKDYEHGYIEIEILHEGIHKELKFNGLNEWVKTEWEVRQLPEAVKKTVTDGGYQLDDSEFDYVETSTQTWYEVEVRQGHKEMKLHISPEGKILHTEYDD